MSDDSGMIVQSNNQQVPADFCNLQEFQEFMKKCKELQQQQEENEEEGDQ